MYAYISGKIAKIYLDAIVVDNNGIGYFLNASANTLRDVGAVGEAVKLYTYQQVKEDAISLFGFYSEEEKRFFENLISVSGIGPKIAMQILSGFDLKTLAAAIACGDSKKLTQIKGIGKKTAERLILELKESFSVGGKAIVQEITYDDGVTEDAVFALLSLGLTKGEAVSAVSEAKQNVAGLENIIQYALKHLKR